MELIDFYKKLLDEKRTFIDKQIQRYQQGLSILAETKSKVEGLQKDLQVKMVEVGKKQQETDVLIEKVGKESAIAEQESQIANEQEARTDEASRKAEKIKIEAETALSEALPALKQAENAVDCLKKPHVTEMKNLGSPPPGVIVTARVVLILTGEKVTLSDPDDKVWKKG